MCLDVVLGYYIQIHLEIGVVPQLNIRHAWLFVNKLSKVCHDKIMFFQEFVFSKSVLCSCNSDNQDFVVLWEGEKVTKYDYILLVSHMITCVSSAIITI
jgi:hypothetical protein